MARTTTTTNSIPSHGTYITYDRLTGDYAMYFNGVIVGYAATSGEATTTLNNLVYENLRRTPAVAAPSAVQDQAA